MQQCILSFEERKEVLELPYPLQEWTLSSPHNTYNFTTINTGEVLAIGKKNLKSITINSVFPAKNYPFLLNKNYPEPEACVQMIEKWKNSGKPIRVVIVDTDINYAMAIEDFSHGMESMDGSKDVTFTLSLIEYSYLNVERSNPKSAKNKKDLKDRPGEKKESGAARHKVKQGDTLWDLSAKYLGNPRRWQEIAKLNNITNPRTLQIGTELKLPANKDNKK